LGTHTNHYHTVVYIWFPCHAGTLTSTILQGRKLAPTKARSNNAGPGSVNADAGSNNANANAGNPGGLCEFVFVIPRGHYAVKCGSSLH
jgi:hypothetical protein